ncbi:MAG: hypothetical protein H5T50_03445 [Nitrososphaeria archaeon]|nr:hypothetical protein [Nitrososphaeria archaeon]
MKIKPIFAIILTLILIPNIIYTVHAYDNSPTWTKSIENFASEKYRVSLTGDQSLVYTINRSFVIGLSTYDGNKRIEYLPARYGDMVDGLVVHSSGSYIVSIINGTFVSVYNRTSYKITVFKANSTVENIILPKKVDREYTIVYTTSDGNITCVEANVPGNVVVKWNTRMTSKIIAIDCDEPFYRILAGLDDGTVALVDPVEGKIFKSIKLDDSITSLKVSSFGFFATVTTKSELYILRTDTLYILERIGFPNTQCTSSSISYDGGRIAVGLGNGTIFYYKPLTEEYSKTVISSNAIKIFGDKKLDYIAWTSGGRVGVTKFMGETLWSYTVSTTTDVSIAFNDENPNYLIACTKTRVMAFTRKAFAKITLEVSPKVIGLGNNVTFKGTIEPKLSNQTIKFYIQNQGLWEEIGWTLTDKLGAFKFTYKPTKAGLFTVKALWEGNEEFKETSTTNVMDVRKPVAIEIRTASMYGKPIQNLKITVNGTRYYTNTDGRAEIEAYAGTLNIVVENVQNITSNMRYKFKVWENMGVEKNQLTIKVDSNITLTAKYSIEYRLTVETPKYFLYDLSPSSPDQWYENGTKVEAIILPIESFNTTTTRIVFMGWEGTGAGAYTGTSRKATISVFGPVYEKILWKKQYKLNILMTPSILNLNNVSVQPFSRDYWYDDGVDVEIEAPEQMYVEENVRYVFAQCKYDNTITSSRKIILKLDSPRTVNITYYVQYYLKVTSDFGNTEGKGWYNSSQKAVFRIINSTIYVSEGIRKVFVEWRGNISSTSPVGQIILNGPANVHAAFVTQYFLNVSSEYSQVLSKTMQQNPSKWYNEGVEVTFYILDLTVDRDFFTYYSFEGWRGDIESTEPMVTLKMVKPYNIRAQWKLEWKISNVIIVALPIIVAAAIMFWLIYSKKKKVKGK